MPKFVLDGETVKNTGEKMPVPVAKIPISLTMASISSTLVVDPTSEEEAVMDARITLTTDEEGHICAGQKGEPGSLTPEQIMTAAEWALERGKEIRNVVREATGRAQA
jgi:exosome complex component RRP42